MFHGNDENVAVQANTSAAPTYQKAMSGHVATIEDLKSYMLKDLRILCREKGVNPAGGKEALIERLLDAQGAGQIQIVMSDKAAPNQSGDVTNNYNRQEGQNIGNFITDRPSSRVLQQPGGQSQISFNDGSQPTPPPANNFSRNQGNFMDHDGSKSPHVPGGGASQITFNDGHEGHAVKKSNDNFSKPGDGAPSNSLHMGGPGGVNSNNYVRSEGQNVGNFITDRSSSRVLAPPGGASSFSLG